MNITDIIFIRDFYRLNRSPYLSIQRVPSIGYGLSIYPDTGLAVTMQDQPITTAQATEYLKMHIEGHIGPYLKVLLLPQLNANQIDAIYSFAYRIGIDAFRGSKLLEYINNDVEHPRIYQEFHNWNRVNDRISDTLILRGVKEANMFIKPMNFSPSK